MRCIVVLAFNTLKHLTIQVALTQTHRCFVFEIKPGDVCPGALVCRSALAVDDDGVLAINFDKAPCKDTINLLWGLIRWAQQRLDGLDAGLGVTLRKRRPTKRSEQYGAGQFMLSHILIPFSTLDGASPYRMMGFAPIQLLDGKL